MAKSLASKTGEVIYLKKGDKGDTGATGAQGPQGVPGAPGSNGQTYYTWIKYADTSTGGGISNDPTNKTYIGFAYNKTTATESNTPADYTWSLIKGPKGDTGVQGATGSNGQTFYTWIKYSDYADGTNLYDTPNSNTKYIGIAVNKTTAAESSVKTDYVWSQFKGDTGDKGDKGDIGVLIYPAGEYSSTISYSRTTLSAPMVLHEEKYYVLNKEGTFVGFNPKKDYAANGNKARWVLMDKVKYAFIEMLMANFAKLASAVFYGQYMFSQQGTNASGAATSDYRKFGTDDFTPNLMLDFLTGTFKGKKVEVDGGVFKNIRSPNDSFRIKENGEIEIVGKISTSLNGTRIELDPSTNSIKMYNQNGSVVGDIRFVEEQWGGNINYHPMIKLTDYHNSARFAETILRAGGLTITDSTLGGDVYDSIISPSMGLIFTKNGKETKRYANT